MQNIAKKWEVFERSFIEYGGYERVIDGLKNTLIIALIGLCIGIFIGTLIAVVRVMPGRTRFTKVMAKILNGICSVYTSFFRGTPIVVQLLLGYYVILPLMGINLKPVSVCILIFGLNSGAYVSEIMRGGIGSVDPGQMEAGRAVGLGYWATMLKIIVPQAVKNIMPTLGNELISLVKETSVVSFVGALDLYTAFRYIAANNYEFMIPYLVMAAFYIVIVLVIALGVKLMERRLKKSDRNS
ncbi:MAG: amino acid ABC transporter permease [Clostridia bacterium]|nr:amino acid ABC transporter permease [Clostridia bacterium]